MIFARGLIESLNKGGSMYEGIAAKRMYIFEVLFGKYAHLLPVRELWSEEP